MKLGGLPAPPGDYGKIPDFLPVHQTPLQRLAEQLACAYVGEILEEGVSGFLPGPVMSACSDISEQQSSCGRSEEQVLVTVLAVLSVFQARPMQGSPTQGKLPLPKGLHSFPLLPAYSLYTYM